MGNSYNTDDKSTANRLKRFIANRAVIVTIVTLLLAVGVIVAVTVAANRSRRPIGGESASGSATATGDGKQVMNGDETKVNHNANETHIGAAETGKDEPLVLSLPTNGKLLKGHDATLQVYSSTMGDYRVHLGVDISTPEGGEVCAAAAGKVSKVWTDPLMGQCVAVDHGDELLTVYKNLSADLASGIAEGKTVKAGQKLGNVGDSAMLEMAEEPHLHFEVTAKGIQVDPLEYFSAADVTAIKAANADTSFESSAVTESTSAGK